MILKVPLLKQKYKNGCGVTATKMVYKYFGKEVPEKKIIFARNQTMEIIKKFLIEKMKRLTKVNLFDFTMRKLGGEKQNQIWRIIFLIFKARKI